MRVVGVIVGIEQAFQRIGHVGHVVIVDLGQQVLGNEALDAVLGGEDHVIRAGIGADGHHHVLVGGKAHVVDMDACFFFKLVQDGLIDVVLPVVDVDDLLRGSGKGQKQSQGKQKNQPLFHDSTS